MGAVADGAEAVKGWRADRGSEIAVGAAASGGLSERKTHLQRQDFGFGEKRGTGFAFERRAIKAAASFQLRSGKNWTERLQAALNAAHIRDTECAKIEDGFGAFGDDVYARAAFDYVRIHGDAAAGVVPFLDSCDLAREFVDSIDAFFWREASMGGATVNDEFDFAHTLARSLYQSAWTERGLENEDGVTAAGFSNDEFPRSVAANFFVGSPEKDQSPSKRCLGFLECFKSEEGLHNTGFHIENAGAVGLSGRNVEGHFGERTGGIDGVVMAEDKELAFRARVRRPPRSAKHIAAMILCDSLDACAAPTP